MHDQLSKIDELFLDASLKEEQRPAEGDWEAMRNKLFLSRLRKRRFVIWLSVFLSASLIVLSAVLFTYYSANNTKAHLDTASRFQKENPTRKIIRQDMTNNTTPNNVSTVPVYYTQGHL